MEGSISGLLRAAVYIENTHGQQKTNEDLTEIASILGNLNKELGNQWTGDEIDASTTILGFKWDDASLYVERSHIEASFPGFEAELSPMSVDDKELPAREEGKNGIIVHSKEGGLRLARVDELKEAWSGSSPHTRILSRSNMPELFKKVFHHLFTPGEGVPDLNIIGVIDTHSPTSRLLEDLLINEFGLEVTHNDLPAQTAPRTPKRDREEIGESKDGPTKRLRPDNEPNSSK